MWIGKHVLSEKPVGPTIAAGQDLIAEYRSKYEGKGLQYVSLSFLDQ